MNDPWDDGADARLANHHQVARAAELQLVRRVLAGDEAAIRELVDHLTPVVQSRVARVLVRHGESMRQHTADYTQEVLEDVFRGNLLYNWNANAGGSLRNYVGASAHYHVVEKLRTRRQRPFTDELEPEVIDEALSGESSPEARAASRELLRRLMEHLFYRLSPERFELFRRIFIESESPEQLRAELNMSVSALDQCRARLRREARAVLASIDPRFKDIELTTLLALLVAMPLARVVP